METDRSRVAQHARDIEELSRTGKLSPRLKLLQLTPKPQGQLTYADYRVGTHDELLGEAGGGEDGGFSAEEDDEL